jgi:hypothetical protein
MNSCLRRSHLGHCLGLLRLLPHIVRCHHGQSLIHTNT